MSVRVGPPPSVEAPNAAPAAPGAAFPKQRRQILVPARQPRPRANGALHFSLAIALAGAVGLLYIFQSSAVAGLGLELSRLQREFDSQAIRNEELSYQLAYYESLPVIEQLALEQRGMRPMESSLFLSAERPVDEELSLPQEDAQSNRSIAQRALDRLLGKGGARDRAGGSSR